jgi:hypothetical protein
MTFAVHVALPTVGELLAALGVEATPVYPEMPGVPVASLDIRDEWEEVAREWIPAAYRAWALPAFEDATGPEAQWADNAVLMVWRLSRPVDPMAVMRCAFTDSRRLPDWREFGGQARDYDGFPSAAIIGSYFHAGLTLWSFTRYLIAGTSAGQYLLQLTVTTRLDDNKDGQHLAGSLSVGVPAPSAPAERFEFEGDSVAGESGNVEFRI